ncbi:fumarylacetoacetate hydrolase family protein [Nocardia nova]|uniref:fumarylacetoacetate hydrolase family protein n=1 Tax=Nocardia nova TaxID=37330 RepID=UPI0033C77095
MKLITFVAPGSHLVRAGELREGRAVAFTDEGTVLEHLTAEGHESAQGPDWPIDDVTLLAPIAEPRIIYCVALNYKSHIDETGFDRPDRPQVFVKQPGASVAGNSTIARPAVVEKLDYEGELAAVIGAYGQVAGYAVANDLSARDLQKKERQWTRAKGADGFCPWGPWITTADEVADAADLTVRTWVNDELRQEFSTADMLFGIEELTTFIAETNALRPGDLLLTGTGAGIGESFDPPRFLGPGDAIRIAIDGLGEIRHNIAVP